MKNYVLSVTALAFIGCHAAPTTEARIEDTPPVATELDDREARLVVADAVDAYLVAYREALLNQTLQPSAEQWAQVEQKTAGLDSRARGNMKNMATTLVDYAIGFDFVPPLRMDPTILEQDPRPYLRTGYFRSVPDVDQSVALLDAVRMGVRLGMNQQDPMVAMEPVIAFFEMYPEYHPMHTGRCYPHGHEQYDGLSGVDCIADTMRRAVGFMLYQGDGLLERAEMKAGVAQQQQSQWKSSCSCYLNDDCGGWWNICWHGVFSYLCNIDGSGSKSSNDGVCGEGDGNLN